MDATETPKPFANFTKVVEGLRTLASIGPDDDGLATAMAYAKFHYDATKSVEENIDYIGNIISQDQ
jgi:hypothetical protein